MSVFIVAGLAQLVEHLICKKQVSTYPLEIIAHRFPRHCRKTVLFGALTWPIGKRFEPDFGPSPFQRRAG